MSGKAEVYKIKALFEEILFALWVIAWYMNHASSIPSWAKIFLSLILAVRTIAALVGAVQNTVLARRAEAEQGIR